MLRFHGQKNWPNIRVPLLRGTSSLRPTSSLLITPEKAFSWKKKSQAELQLAAHILSFNLGQKISSLSCKCPLYFHHLSRTVLPPFHPRPPQHPVTSSKPVSWGISQLFPSMLLPFKFIFLTPLQYCQDVLGWEHLDCLQPRSNLGELSCTLTIL